MRYTLIKIFFAPLLALLLLAAPSLGDDDKSARLLRTVSVSGHGEVLAVPDLASVSVGVTSFADTARAALSANNKTMADLRSLLKEAGIAERDTSTSNFAINPRYDYGQGGTQPPKIVGYDVTNTVTITARKIDTLGDLLDKAVSAGSNQIFGISFAISKPDDMLDEARKLAVADARRKAEIYASASAVKLGAILSIVENGGILPPVPMMAKALRAEAASDVPIAQGEQTLAVDVSIVWEIK